MRDLNSLIIIFKKLYYGESLDIKGICRIIRKS
jgi:hypothetical protein